MNENKKRGGWVRKLKDKQLEDILEMIIDGKTFRDIAQKYEVSISMLQKYLSQEKHSARSRSALLISSNSYADMGEEVLKNAKGNIVEIQRARELAQHYRWKASKRSPRIYGEKLDVTSAGDKINEPSVDLSKLSEEELKTFIVLSDKAKSTKG